MDLKLIIYAAVLSALVAAGAYIKETIGDRAVLQMQNEQLKDTLTAMRIAWMKDREQVAEIERRQKEAEVEHKRKVQKLEAALAAARAGGDQCIDAVIPDAVLEQLRQHTGAGGDGVPSPAGT